MGCKGKYAEWITDDGLLRIFGWARDGLSDEQIAHNMGIRRSTLAEWSNRFPDIADTIKKGKAPADIEVENALYKSAIGYSVTVKKPIKVKEKRMIAGKGTIEEEHIEFAEEEVYIPPNTTAQIFWLKNRRPDNWRDKQIEAEDRGTLDKLDEMLAEVKNHAANAQTS